MPETIGLLLKELKLPAFMRHYQRNQEQATEQGYGHVRYLSGLCEQEIVDRYQKRVQKWASFISRFALFAITDLIKQEKAMPLPV